MFVYSLIVLVVCLLFGLFVYSLFNHTVCSIIQCSIKIVFDYYTIAWTLSSLIVCCLLFKLFVNLIAVFWLLFSV